MLKSFEKELDLKDIVLVFTLVSKKSDSASTPIVSYKVEF